MSYSDWRERFLEAVDQSLYPAAWLDQRVADGSAGLLESESAACLLEINTFPSGAREVHCLVAAGEVGAIRALAPEAERIGRELGCVRASIASSPAWARIMKSDGYAPHQLLIVKDL